MQLTRFDRWLLESFAQETHIHTLRPPEALPRGIREVPVPDTPGRRYQRHYVTRSEKSADRLIAILRDSGQMFTTQVTDLRTWYTPLIAPKGKSVTWRIIWIILTAVSLFYATMYLRFLWNSPTFQKNFREAIELFRS